jgi:cytochrome o ubiquinol oxidase operon protein cyoD
MNHTEFNRMVSRYVIGFGAALVLSLFSYLIVTSKLIGSHYGTMALILVLALVQFIVQLVCFLHIGFSKRAMVRTNILLFTITMMLVIVVGSLWIMKNLDYRMTMSGDSMDSYMKAQNKKGF